jgi:hypothetical protein
MTVLIKLARAWSGDGEDRWTIIDWTCPNGCKAPRDPAVLAGASSPGERPGSRGS